MFCKYMHNYRQTYFKLYEFMKSSANKAFSDKYLDLLFGRKRHLPSSFDSLEEWKKGGILRSMTNAVIQGSGAMIIKKAMVLMYDELKKYDAHIIAQIHDEVIVMCPEEYGQKVKEIVERCMIEPTKNLRVPFDVDCKIGKTWKVIH